MYFRRVFQTWAYMKIRWIILSATGLVALGIAWMLVFRKAGMYDVRQAVPRHAVLTVETPSFNRLRDRLYHNNIWAHLIAYPCFGQYQAHLKQADSLCNVYPVLRKWLTDRPFSISCHETTSGKYDFLYVCDLGKLNVLQVFDGMIGSLLGKEKMVRQNGMTMLDLKGVKLYYTIEANLLLASLSPTLLKESVLACSRKEGEKAQLSSGDILLEVNHHRLDKWLRSMLGEAASVADSSLLKNTSLALSMKDRFLEFKGWSYPNRDHFTMLSALNLVDGTPSDVKSIVSDHVAAYVSVCFPSFRELENILLEEYKVNRLQQYKEVERMLHRWDKYLGVNIEELFTSWIGNEIAVIKPAVDQENRLDNLVLAVKSKDIDLAKDQLAYLTEQISRKTPVRFREMEYNGHQINYLSLKGFFHLFLGSLFQKFDRPYYTFIGDYVVFSNSSSTLAGMIKDYTLGRTLDKQENYRRAMEPLGDRNNVYGYISSPETFEYLFHVLPEEQRKDFLRNKGAFQSFESVGFAMSNTGSVFETRIHARHNTDASQEYEVRELNRKLEDFADRVETGYYLAAIPEDVAVSTQEEYAYATETWKFEGKLVQGDPDGLWFVRDRGGKAVAQYLYRKGKPDGIARFFYPDGVTSALVEYEEGEIKTVKEFFQDGTLKTELEYNRGVRHGKVRFYYSTGHLRGEGKYKKGKRSGAWKYYRVTGELEQKLKF